MEFVQLQINYYDMMLGHAREIYEAARSRAVPVIVMEPVRGGMLARLPEHIGAMLTEANPDVSHASWAIRWVGSLPEVVNVLSGMSNMEQLDDNIKSTKNFVPLSAEERTVTDKVAQALMDLPQVACTSCNYCIDCPEGIPIAKIFEKYNKFLETRSAFGFRQAYKEVAPDKNASHCTSCGVCVAICPQLLDIPARMKEIAVLMDS
jgi:predicted aldo/keto reductase-like oxidoreductase